MNEINVSSLREGVREAYSKAAQHPDEDHPFPVGRDFAESVGYPADLLRGLPAVAVDAFAGVSNLSLLAEIPSGATVLDLGSGAGLDSIIAAGRVGPQGQVLAVDFSSAMLSSMEQAVLESGATNIKIFHSDAESLPLEDLSVDVALVNGIFNLNPERSKKFTELARVVKPGGCVFAAELVLREAGSEKVEPTPENWFA